MKRLSIVIVTYNSEKDIFECVKSVQQYTDIPLSEIELIIVDNNSREVDIMFSNLQKQYGNNIILEKNASNGGYGQGNNVGIRKATAPIILIMNPDIRLIEPVFRTAVEAFDNIPELTIYGMKQMLTPTMPSTSSFTCTYMMNGYISTVLTAICTRLEWYFPSFMYIHGSCFFIRKSYFEEIGLFDESNFMYGEEDDIRYRLRKKGFKKIVYNHQKHYIHLTREREPNLSYELKLINAVISLNAKKGYSVNKTVINRIRNTNLLIIKELIKIN